MISTFLLNVPRKEILATLLQYRTWVEFIEILFHVLPPSNQNPGAATGTSTLCTACYTKITLLNNLKLTVLLLIVNVHIKVGSLLAALRPIRRVIAEITPMHRSHASAACVGCNASGRNAADYAPTLTEIVSRAPRSLICISKGLAAALQSVPVYEYSHAHSRVFSRVFSVLIFDIFPDFPPLRRRANRSTRSNMYSTQYTKLHVLRTDCTTMYFILVFTTDICTVH